MERAKLGIVVGAKGRGSNMMAIADACESEDFPAAVEVVVAPTPDSPALAAARQRGLAAKVAPYGEDFGARLLEVLKPCDLVCLAGFMRLLPSEVLQAFPKRVLNIHPALLPRHGGKGMYGSRVHQAVLDAEDDESGCTVHFVDERYDEGDIILQRRVPVRPGDDNESLASRVLAAEHEAYPAAIRKVLEDM